MLSKIDLQLIVFFIENPEQQLSMRELARKTGVDYRLIYNSVQRLSKENIITKEVYGKTFLFKPNFAADSKYFILAEAVRKESLLKRCKDISILSSDVQESAKNPFFVFMIFGSYSSGKAHERSDIDMAVIAPEKHIAEFEKAVSNALSIRPFKAHYFVISSKSFTDMLSAKEKTNLGKEIFRNHVVLHGAELYYDMVKGALYD